MDAESRLARKIGDAVADSLTQQAARKRPGQDKSPRAFSRVHPTRVFSGAAGGPDLGANLACLRYMSRNPAAGVHQVNVGQGFSLALDPRYTAPNAAVAVSFHGGSAWNEYTVLHPGDVLEVPEGFTRFWCFNADQQDSYLALATQPANANVGFCSFVVGHLPGAIPNLGKQPVGAAALIQHGALNTLQVFSANVAMLAFSPGHCRAIRVQIFPRRADGAIHAAGRVYASVGLYQNARAINIAAPPIFPPDTQTIESDVSSGVWQARPEIQGWATGASGGSDMPDIVFEVPRGAQSLQLALSRAYLDYGAVATTSLYAFIEGVP